MNSIEENLQKFKLLSDPELVFNDYKKTALYIPFGITCCGKCARNNNFDTSLCHNWEHNGKFEEYSYEDIMFFFNRNPFIEALIISGLEPMDNFEDVYVFINHFRKQSNMDIVIYSGHKESNLKNEIKRLKSFKDIIIKFGNYNPKLKPVFNEILGITLISSNQYAKNIKHL